MFPAVPTRITIELQPTPDESGAWMAASLVTAPPREWMDLPAAYEPSDCTCVDGLCNEDHEND